MTDKVKNELFDCMEEYIITPAPTGRFVDLRFDVNPYSPIYEPMIKQAVQYKRAGNYDEAIKCYIDIFKREKCFNTEIVRYLCKVLICDGELLLAFSWLAAAAQALMEKFGPSPNPYVPQIPWAQMDDLLNLVNACVNLQKTRNINSFCNYVAPIAGNPTYRLKCTSNQLFSQANIVLDRFHYLHSKY